MKNVIIDHRASQNTVDALLRLGFNIIKTPKIHNVYNAISGHPDIIIHNIDKKTTLCEPHYVDYFKDKLTDVNVISGDIQIKGEYPYDIAYNAARVGRNIFCLEKYTARRILEYYYNNDYNIINVKQGYAKCSICVVSDDAIITSDKNILIAAERNDIDVLFVEPQNIKLTDYEYGFIGGATGLNGNKLFINGNIRTHINSNSIINFCNKHNVEVCSLHNGDIEDIGSLIFI